MVPFADLLAAPDRIPHPRRRQGRPYPLAHLLLFSVLAVLAGATSYRGILVFIAVHRERLNAVFGAALRRAPAVNTLRALFLALDPAELEAAFRRHAGGLSGGVPAGGPRGGALHGQSPQRRLDHPKDPAAAQVLGAFAGEAALILAHQEIAEGDEIAAAQALDRGPRRAWRPVHRRCPARPEKTFASAANTGAALLVRVKANQPGLHDALVSLCAERDPLDRHATVDRGRHGREEHRRVELFAVAGRLPPEWRGGGGAAPPRRARAGRRGPSGWGGASRGRVVGGRGSPPAGVGGGGRLRRRDHPPLLVQGHPHRPVAAAPRGRLLRQPGRADGGGVRARGPGPLGGREPVAPRP